MRLVCLFMQQMKVPVGVGKFLLLLAKKCNSILAHDTPTQEQTGEAGVPNYLIRKVVFWETLARHSGAIGTGGRHHVMAIHQQTAFQFR